MKIRRQMSCFAVSFAVALVVASPFPGAYADLAGGGWPMFQHDVRHSGQSPYLGPATTPIQAACSFSSGVTEQGSPSLAADGTIYLPGGTDPSATGARSGYLFAVNP